MILTLAIAVCVRLPHHVLQFLLGVVCEDVQGVEKLVHVSIGCVRLNGRINQCISLGISLDQSIRRYGTREVLLHLQGEGEHDAVNAK